MYLGSPLSGHLPGTACLPLVFAAATRKYALQDFQVHFEILTWILQPAKI